MAVNRRVNFLSQQRIDVPDMRSLESAVSNDADAFAQAFITGTQQGYILRGFEIVMAGAIGGAASGLQLQVDPGAVMHIASSQSGTTYLVPTGTLPQQLNSATNVIVDGAFSPSAINYVGLEYERYIDDSTSSQVYLWNPTTESETTKNAPRAVILRYRIKITTSTFAANVLPIATVTTDAGNNVVSITDARWNLFRLGTGGANPNPFYVYPWTAQSEGREENPSTSTSNGSSPFRGGDKMIGTLKDWMNAVMTSIQEMKGTTYWYGGSTAGSIESIREDLGNTIITGRGTITHSDDTAGLMNWSDDINIRVMGTNLTYALVANPSTTDITLDDDQAAYITLVRGVEVSPNLIFSNSSTVVTSVGAVAWTIPLQAGDWVKLSSETDSGYYEILTVDSSSQVTLSEAYAGASTGATGAKATYAFGSYNTSPSPSTDRHIYVVDRKSVPQGKDVFWLFLRSDNAGVVPRVYVRFLGAEIQQGETEDISDNVPLNLLSYVGSPSESATGPEYVSALDPGSVPEIADLLFGNASTITNESYFFITSSGNYRQYYVWANKDGTGSDPAVLGYISIEVPITTGMTSAQVAAAYASALSSTPINDFLAVQKAVPNNNQVRVTNTSAGSTVDTVNYDMISPFTITKIQDGTGQGNAIIEDGDNLTLSIKKLDIGYGVLIGLLDSPNYDEAVDITTLTASGTVLTLPLNSREGNVQQQYTVGKGVIQLYLNGQYQRVGVDFDEVGSQGSISTDITILRDLVNGDTIEYRMSGLGSGAAGGGGGGTGPQGPPGTAGPPGADAIGGPVAISTKNANYTVQNTDNILLGNAVGGAITFTLPTAASATGRVFFFKKIDASANAVNVQANGIELIDGLNAQSTSTQYESFQVISDGATWYIF